MSTHEAIRGDDVAIGTLKLLRTITHDGDLPSKSMRDFLASAGFVQRGQHGMNWLTAEGVKYLGENGHLHQKTYLQQENESLRKQRDFLLELTWLDLPGEPTESFDELRAQFNKGWMRKSDEKLAADAELKDLRAKVQVLYDIHEKLGIEWGEDPYAAINRLVRSVATEAGAAVNTSAPAQNTKVFGPRGERIDGIISVKVHPIDKDTPLHMGTATITVYTEGSGPVLERPMLGLATTKELLEELSARAEIHGYAGYRTVDGD